MQEHLGHCPACQDLFTELTELNSRLGAILTPAALAAASSALGSAKRAAILRAGLTGHWRTWRWHPVPFARKRKPGGGSPGGGAASVAARSVPRSPAGAGSLAAVTPPSGPIAGALPGGSAPAQAGQPPSNSGITVTSTPANPS
jgi:hypothetical protein